jgi:hypothetical protein
MSISAIKGTGNTGGHGLTKDPSSDPTRSFRLVMGEQHTTSVPSQTPDSHVETTTNNDPGDTYNGRRDEERKNGTNQQGSGTYTKGGHINADQNGSKINILAY